MDQTKEPVDSVRISVMSIDNGNTFAVMLSHRNNHSLLPWTYTNKDAAITDADNLASCLAEHGFIDPKADPQQSFEWKEEGGVTKN